MEKLENLTAKLASICPFTTIQEVLFMSNLLSSIDYFTSILIFLVVKVPSRGGLPSLPLLDGVGIEVVTSQPLLARMQVT